MYNLNFIPMPMFVINVDKGVTDGTPKSYVKDRLVVCFKSYLTCRKLLHVWIYAYEVVQALTKIQHPYLEISSLVCLNLSHVIHYYTPAYMYVINLSADYTAYLV